VPRTTEEDHVSLEHEELDVALPDGTLRVLRWGHGSQAALAVHGITASAMSWQAVARELPADWSLFAVDLRGRGHSAGLPGPYGFDRHVADLVTAAGELGLDRPVLAGHSLGAYVTLLATARHPDRFGGLLLVDGGLPLPVPADVDLDAVLEASLGPALARLRQTFPSVTAYFDFWRAHPALKDAWNPDIEDYLRYDLTGPAGALRSRVVEKAARTDGRELLGGTERFGAALGALPWPVTLLTAPAGLFGEPPGMQSPELCAAWLPRAPLLLVEEVPGCNHYTLTLDPAHAATVANRITRATAP
jgi:pimeloyl-ACP methyl ester carboxylesterase